MEYYIDDYRGSCETDDQKSYWGILKIWKIDAENMKIGKKIFHKILDKQNCKILDIHEKQNASVFLMTIKFFKVLNNHKIL